ncbi:MAG: putative ABC transport system permease protein [Bacteroidetes bacterium]|nr:MAG: putative ABC transport system permease protein [Bacteroidota bacterium]
MLLFFRLLQESFRFAVTALLVNKVRTILSLLGITIGIFSIIAVFSVFDSLEKSIRSDINSLGDNILFVQKWPWASGSDYPWWKYWQRPEASLRELAELEKRSNAAQSFAFMTGDNRSVSFESINVEDVSVNAVSHDYSIVMPFDLESGRYFTSQESQSGRNVVIIGAEVAEALFPTSDPIGQTVKVFGLKLDVIGVMKKQGENLFGNSNDKSALIPVQFGRNVIDLRNGTTIVARAKAGVSNEELEDELRGIMRSIRKIKPTAEDNFAINEMDIINKSFDQLFSVIAIVGWVIGGFSLLVGGFGIANIMFVSVKERTNQIGIQKSLGAKNYFILLQFLFEAIFLAILGGIVGLLIVFTMSVIVSSTTSFQLGLSFQNVLLGLSVSGLIGLVSGFIPAWSASRLDPVEAMRSNF